MGGSRNNFFHYFQLCLNFTMRVKLVTLTYVLSGKLNLAPVLELPVARTACNSSRSRDWNERDWTLRRCAMLVLHDVFPCQTGHSAEQ